MDLPAPAQSIYAQLWGLVSSGITSINPATGRVYSTTDINEAASIAYGELGIRLPFQAFTGLAQLYGIASAMEHAADALTAAADSEALDTSVHVAEPPWSRSLQLMQATPEWQLRAEITYRAPDGSVVTTWGTGVFKLTLPSTVGALRQEAQLQFQRYLSQRSEEKNTGGELLSIGRTYLLAV